MDIIIISSERNILHIFKDEDHVDYTLYNNAGISLDGGVLDVESDKNTNELVKDIIDSLKGHYSFKEPYICPNKDDTQIVIESVEEEDYQNMIFKVNRLLEEPDFDLERE